MEISGLLAKYQGKLFMVGVVLVTLIYVANLYSGQNQKIETLRATRDSEVKKNEVLVSISNFEKKMNSYKKFFSKRDISSVINTISNMAKESNVKIISMKPRQEENFPAYVKYPFDIVIGVDSYHVIAKFINKIENHPDVFFIDRFEIKTLEKVKESEQQSNKLFVGLTISTVVFKN